MSCGQHDDFDDDQHCGNEVRTPDVEPVAAHVQKVRKTCPLHAAAPTKAFTHSALRSRSRMIARTRHNVAAMEYIQNARAMISMPTSMVAAIVGLFITLT